MNNTTWDSGVLADVCAALENDPVFQFRKSGTTLRQGVCPNCGDRYCFVELSNPGRVSCGHLSRCKWSMTTRELYPDIFDNLKKRHPATQDNPNATADAFLRDVRGLDIERIKGWYFQSNIKNSQKDEYYPCVKFIVNQNCYWTRVIDRSDERKNGAKSKIVGDFKGTGWIPPGMTFNVGDTVWITEGIFKSIALLQSGRKSISALSASNFPRDIIKANAGKKILWVIALDSDDAGFDNTPKYMAECIAMSESVVAAFPEPGEDWDDALKAGKLTDGYLNDSIWRGYYNLAEDPKRKAFFKYCQTQRDYFLFSCRRKLYKCKVDKEEVTEDNHFVYPRSGNWMVPDREILTYIEKFSSFAKVEMIAPAEIKLLYQERDIITGEGFNTFYLDPANGSPATLMTEKGSILQKPDTFDKALLDASMGNVYFDGSKADLSILHDRWFFRRPCLVKKIPFMGFEPESGCYVFPDFAYFRGERFDANQYGYSSCGRHSVRCVCNDIRIKRGCDDFTGDWLRDYLAAFDLNGLVLLGWWVGTLFTKQVKQMTGNWPFLEYTGEAGSGKSTQLRFLWRSFGVDSYEGFDPNTATAAGRARAMSCFSNLPTIFLEGDRDTGDVAKKRAFQFQDLKGLFDDDAPLRVRGVKNGGNDTDRMIFRGAILISQNTMVMGDEAILSRIVHCHCTRDHFTADNAQAAMRLRNMTSRELGGFLPALLGRERALLAAFRANNDLLYREFLRRDVTKEVNHPRVIECHAKVAAWIRSLPEVFAGRLPKEWVDRAIDHLWERAKARISVIHGDTPVLEQFWGAYEYLHEGRGADGVVSELLNHSRDPKLIAINLPHFMEVAANHKQMLPPATELQQVIRSSSRYPFKGVKSVRSAIFNKVMTCYVFEDCHKNEN